MHLSCPIIVGLSKCHVNAVNGCNPGRQGHSLSASKPLAQALDRFFSQWWNPSNCKAEVVSPFTFYWGLLSLKLILAHVISHSSPWRSRLHPGTDVVITVKSSKKAIMGGCYVPDLDFGRLHSNSADFTSMFIHRESDTKIIQPVIIPFSRLFACLDTCAKNRCNRP